MPNENHSERWQVGSTSLTALVEAETPGIPIGLFYPEATADDLVGAASWLDRGSAEAADGTIAFRVQCFALEHRGLRILVDPCVGNGKHLTMPFWNELALPWLNTLQGAGFDPAEIDLVIHTHLHEDHIGWDTQFVDGSWQPTFPNARHIYVGEELEWAASEPRRQAQDPFAESIAPIIDAGLSQEVRPDADLGDGLRLLSTPGHTPGHVALQIDTGGDPLVITGDLLHHPFQLGRPLLAEVGDVDTSLSARTRQDFFAEHAGAPAVIAGTHFPINPLGHIENHGPTWRWTSLAPNGR